ncbi:MAG: hypothetical protein KBT36_11850 [Kurthia sp.]|nr:hypothetical protein [Candidatus Kurthia equi]
MFEDYEGFSNEIIEFTKNAWDGSVELATRFNNLIGPIAPILDATAVIVPGAQLMVKGLQSCVQISSRIRLNSFLKNFAMTADGEGVTEEQMRKMWKYLNDEKTLIYISDLIASSVQSQSADCSGVMGYYAGSLLKNSQAINYQDMVVLNALKIMTKNDLENFLKLYGVFSNSDGIIRVFNKEREFQEFGVPIFEMENTMEKMKNVQVFGYDIGGIGGVGNAWGAFKVNDNTHYFYNILMKSGVVNI